MGLVSYILGERFPDERFISSGDCIKPCMTDNSFDVILTLQDNTIEERKAIICDKFYVSIFVHKQIPHIIFDFKQFKFAIALNVQKITTVSAQNWIYNDESTVKIFLLEAGTGNLLNIRILDFPLMTELKYLLRLELPLSKDTIDMRIHEVEGIYSVQEMEDYSIFYDEVPASGIHIKDSEDSTETLIF